MAQYAILYTKLAQPVAHGATALICFFLLCAIQGYVLHSLYTAVSFFQRLFPLNQQTSGEISSCYNRQTQWKLYIRGPAQSPVSKNTVPFSPESFQIQAAHKEGKEGARCVKLHTHLARPEGFEPPAFRIGICCDIQLRYGRIWKLIVIITRCSINFNHCLEKPSDFSILLAKRQIKRIAEAIQPRKTDAAAFCRSFIKMG